jgi:hypothetical protein
MPFGHGRDKQPFFPAAFARVEIIAKALLMGRQPFSEI